jgi:hypothetical protein
MASDAQRQITDRYIDTVFKRQFAEFAASCLVNNYNERQCEGGH